MIKLKTYWQALQKVRLTKDEKNVMYQNIAFVMAKNPIPNEPEKQSFFHRFFFVKRPFAFATLIVFLVAFSGGSISYAATDAQPGDLLYPIKVDVNEEVVGALQFTPQGKSNWEMERVRRRLQEVEKLAEEGKLTPELEAKITQHLEAHANKVQQFITNFESDGDVSHAENTTTNLKNVFDQHQVILQKLAENGGPISHPQKPPLDDVLKIIKENGGKLPPLPFKNHMGQDNTTLSSPPENSADTGSIENTENQETTLSTNPQNPEEFAQKHLDGFGQKVQILNDFVAANEDKDPAQLEKLKSELTDLSALYQQSQEAVAAGEYAVATGLFQQAQATFKDAKAIMKEIAPLP